MGVRALVGRCPALFETCAETAVSRLVACAARGEYEITHAAAECLAALVAASEPLAVRCARALVPCVAAAAEPRAGDDARGEALAALRALARCLPRVPSPDLARGSSLGGALLDGVCGACGAPQLEMRKAAVLCLRELWARVGDACTPELQKRLTAPQMKLVTIYIMQRGRG